MPDRSPVTGLVEARPQPNIGAPGGSWRTFSPGQMPKGRVVEPEDAEDLADHGLGGERLYLEGEFTVTAAQENRAVLRTPGAATGRGSVRVIVEFPAGMQPPVEGSVFRRDEARPFEIRDVRRGADGQINVYVREVTNP